MLPVLFATRAAIWLPSLSGDALVSPTGRSGYPGGQAGHTGTVFVFILLSFAAKGKKWPQINSQQVSLAPRELSLVPQTGVRLLD